VGYWPSAGSLLEGRPFSRWPAKVRSHVEPGTDTVVMVERAVLLHQHNDVFDVLDRAATAVGGDARGASDGAAEAAGHRRGRGGTSGELEEAAAVDVNHGGLLTLGRTRQRSGPNANAAPCPGGPTVNSP
jgi:hypothetical protein